MLQKKSFSGVFGIIITIIVLVLFVEAFRWVCSSTEDPRVPVPRWSYDTALLCDSSVTTIEFDYDESNGMLTIVVEACPPLWFGQLTGGDTLQHYAREETKKQVAAFQAQHPELEIHLVNQEHSLATSWFRSSSSGNRRTIVTTIYSTKKR